MGVCLFASVLGAIPSFDLIKKSNFDEMWKTYSIFDKPSDDLKDLLQKMLNADPAKRISLGEIRDHEWFGMADKGPEGKIDEHTIANKSREKKIAAAVSKRNFLAEDRRGGDSFNNFDKND